MWYYLKRKYGEGLYYFKTNEEVDFYIPDLDMGIHVSYSLRNQDVINREVKGLKLLNEKHPLNKILINTRDEKKEIILDEEKKIDVIPVWQWLLEE